MYLFYQINNRICTGFEANCTAVKAQIIVMHLTPLPVCIIIIVNASSFICYFHKLCCFPFGNIMRFHNLFDFFFLIAVNENVKRILPVTQNIICASADNYTRTLLCKLKNDFSLHGKDIVIH